MQTVWISAVIYFDFLEPVNFIKYWSYKSYILWQIFESPGVFPCADWSEITKFFRVACWLHLQSVAFQELSSCGMLDQKSEYTKQPMYVQETKQNFQYGCGIGVKCLHYTGSDVQCTESSSYAVYTAEITVKWWNCFWTLDSVSQGTMPICNTGNISPVNMAQHPRRLESSTLLWEPQTL